MPCSGALFYTEVMASGNRERHRILSLKEESPGERTPGDTLPWNLSKYQKVRRSKSASAEVLDPAERAVIRIADVFLLSFCFGQQ
ncbi:plectin isoform X5 [Silurus asotus]|uniref:Plectin isoform X5 n=1 Tax=Silurus asotus TaxID=30991 RepID=A0AAD5F8M4_SILAS|nr:plectin isoform X5 [Silurus asotus]